MRKVQYKLDNDIISTPVYTKEEVLELFKIRPGECRMQNKYIQYTVTMMEGSNRDEKLKQLTEKLNTLADAFADALFYDEYLDIEVFNIMRTLVNNESLTNVVHMQRGLWMNVIN